MSLERRISRRVGVEVSESSNYDVRVFDRILKQMREMVRRGRYVMTIHADEEADADGFSVFDVESAILTG